MLYNSHWLLKIILLVLVTIALCSVNTGTCSTIGETLGHSQFLFKVKISFALRHLGVVNWRWFLLFMNISLMYVLTVPGVIMTLTFLL